MAPAAALLSLLREPATRRLVPRFFLSFALPAAAVLLVLVLVTRGQAWSHLVTYAATADYSLTALGKGYESFVVSSAPLLAVILLGLGACSDRLLGRRDRPFALYWLLNLGALVTTAKAGAAQNYLIEPWLATVLLGAGFQPGTPRARWTTRGQGRPSWHFGLHGVNLLLLLAWACGVNGVIQDGNVRRVSLRSAWACISMPGTQLIGTNRELTRRAS